MAPNNIGNLTALSPAFVTAGLGAHKIACSPDGKFIYVASENAKIVTVYERGVKGELTEKSTIAAGAAPCDIQITPNGKYVYVADGPGSTTVHCYSRNEVSGALTLIEAAAANAAPRNIAISSDSKFLYCSNSTATTITQFKIVEANGKLEQLSPATVTVGTEPRGICLSPDGTNLYTGNFGSANVSELKRNTTTGLCEALTGTPVTAGLKADIVTCSGDGKNVYCTDFGTTTVHQYERGVEGKLTPLTAATVTCGSGPTDIAVSKDLRNVYVCCFNAGTFQEFSRSLTNGELTLKNTYTTVIEMEGVCLSPDDKFVYAVSWEATPETKGRVFQYSRVPALGELTLLTPKDIECQEEPQHVTVSPDNKFVHVANAKSGTMSIYERSNEGVLKLVEHVVCAPGTYDIIVSPDGKHLYTCNRDAGAAKAICQFSRDSKTGKVTKIGTGFKEMKGATGTAEGTEKAGPHSIVISDDGKFVYLCTQSKPGKVYQYERNLETGALTALVPESFTTTRMLFDLRLSPAANNPYAFGVLLGVLGSKEQGEVIVFSRNASTGLLALVEVVSAGTSAQNSGACAVSPDGKHLYVTNKEPLEGGGPEEPHTHGVSAFSIGVGGKLTLLEQLPTFEEPRGIWLSADGANVYVCDQGQRYIHCFDRNAETGALILKMVADTGDALHWPSHGSVSPNACNYYAADKNVTPPKTSQFSRFAALPLITKPATHTSTKGVATSLQISATNTNEFKASGLPAGLTIDSISGLISGTPTTLGESTVTITAKGTGGESVTTFAWKIEESAVPTVEKPPDQRSTVGLPITPFTVKATGETEFKASGLPEGSLPEGVEIGTTSGEIKGTPGKVQTVNVIVTVKGPGGEASTEFKWIVEAAPTINTPSEQIGHVGSSALFQIEPAGQHSYDATGLPAGLSINKETGQITGIPTTVSTKTVTIKSFNIVGTEAKTTFTWKIEAALPPSISNPGNQVGRVGTAVSLQLVASNTTEFKVVGLPKGLSMTSGGLITGTPTSAETVEPTVTVKGSGGEASTKFKWTVEPAEVYGPSSVNPTANYFYGALEPLAFEDQKLGYPLLKFCDALSSMWSDIDPIIRDKLTANHLRIPGYSSVMNLGECPPDWLPWLAQFSGVQAPPGNAPLDRELIIGAEGMHRGTASAIQKRVALLLTGAKRVTIFERFEKHAYRLLVVTYRAETPVPEAIIRRAIEEVMPAGMILTVVIAESWIYTEVPVAEATYTSVRTDYKTYQGLASHQKGK